MSEANPARGEFSLKLGSKSYRLRPSFAAMQAIEARTGRSIVALTRAANHADLTLAEIGIVAATLIRAGASEDDLGARNADAERIGELAYEEGREAVMPRLLVALVAAVTGGVTAAGEPKASASKGTITDA